MKLPPAKLPEDVRRAMYAWGIVACTVSIINDHPLYMVALWVYVLAAGSVGKWRR